MPGLEWQLVVRELVSAFAIGMVGFDMVYLLVPALIAFTSRGVYDNRVTLRHAIRISGGAAFIA